MNIASSLKAAVARAETKQAVKRLLHLLTPDDRAGVLADLLAEEGASGTASGKLRVSGSRHPRSRARSLSMPNGLKGKLLAALRDKPGMPIADLAARLYGQANRKNHSNVRSMLAALKNKGLVTAPERGKWEVVEGN